MRMLTCFFYLAFFVSCRNKEQQAVKVPLEPSSKTGKELAMLHCGSCHMYPDPSALPSEIWKTGVLPKMSLFMGQSDPMDELIKLPEAEMMDLLNRSIYPDSPRMHAEDWQKIQDFYIKSAPLALEMPKSIQKKELDLFSIKQDFQDANEIVSAKILNNTFFVSKADKSEMQIAAGKNFENRNTKTGKAILDVAVSQKYGNIYLEAVNMNPNDQELGYLKSEKGDVLVSKLRRPVSMLLGDFNEDAVEDVLIASFGNNIGNLSWYNGKDFKDKHVLIELPGARNMVFEDFDGDGKKDILALMTQAKEGIWFFKNLGKGELEPKEILSFPSYYGTSFFEYVDIDGDKDKDFVLSMGDNADLSIVLKPFHGVRIFENNGKNIFKEKHFFVYPGLTQTASADFDLDGDIDIAGICFFPDLKTGNSFVYLENQAGVFIQKTIASLEYTKWLTLEKADIDNDSDLDLILGAFNRGKLGDKRHKKGVYILKNKTK
jgi:FG-GAP-like repeat